MYLKSLYLSGFKSFAHPVELDFNAKISAIVGPNGSGKSNICDAVRFAIGEQRTSEMRSRLMEDIIFSGSNSEKPRGAAEVRLILENEDEPDIIISRTIFKTGETSCKINERNVRLKDIQSFFYDTGLGRNGYAIVSQGGIEKIITSSPQKLREIIEEAVGVQGYRVKKEETKRELKKAEENITRLEDILSLTRERLEPLSIEAEKTREYLELQKQERSLELLNFYEAQEKREAKLEALEHKIVKHQQSLEELLLSANQKKLDLKELEEKILSTEKALEKCRDKRIKFQYERSKLESDLTIKNSKISLYREEQKRLRIEGNDRTKNMITLQRSEISNAKKRLHQSLEIENELSEEIAALKRSPDKTKEQTLLKEVEKLSQVTKKLELTIDLLKSAITKLSSERFNLETEESELENRIDILKNKNYFPAVRESLRYANLVGLEGVYGTVGDLYSTKSDYEKAISVALGGKAQNIVVRDEQVSKLLINNLKRTKKGRATFFPLNQLREVKSKIPESLKNVPGFLGAASRFIKTDPEYQKLFAQLLNRIFIAKTYEAAIELRKRDSHYTYVTLGGEVFLSGGAIVGGEKREKTDSTELSLLRQKKREKTEALENLSTDLAEKKRLLTVYEKRLGETQETLINKREALKEKQAQNTNNFENKFYQLSLKLNDQKLESAKIKQQLIGFEDKLDQLLLTEEQEKQERREREQRRSEIEIDINKLTKEIESINDKISNHDRDSEDLVLKEKRLKEELEELRETKSSVDQSTGEIAEKKERVEKQVLRVELKKERLEETIRDQSELIFQKYQVNFNMLKPEIDKLKQETNTYETVDLGEIRRKMTALGPINSLAIEQYETEREQYEDTASQLEDLYQAKAEVEQAIKDLDSILTEQFKIGFEKLNGIFKKTYKQLFDGGNAELSCKDFSTGAVELYAQPPGKHLKSLNLLSGGEKAMTAIALLLSFNELSPSPFILIDEIDAALDDANIERFTKYLKKSKLGQFILITHRKPTMEICENINGITMTTDGVSQLCKLNFDYFLEE